MSQRVDLAVGGCGIKRLLSDEATFGFAYPAQGDIDLEPCHAGNTATLIFCDNSGGLSGIRRYFRESVKVRSLRRALKVRPGSGSSFGG